MTMTRLSIALIALLGLSGCTSFVREVRVPRTSVERIDASGEMAVSADDSVVSVQASCVTPVPDGSPVQPPSHRFPDFVVAWNSAGRCKGGSEAFSAARAAWLAQPGWREAKVRFVAREPRGPILILGGLVAGAVVGGYVGTWAVRCDESPGVSCEDSSSLSFIGGFLGAGIGAIAGMTLGWGVHELTAPDYHSSDR